MSRRTGPPAPRRPDRPAAPAWAIRLIVVLAAALVVAGVVVSVATGTLFSVPGGR